MTASAPIVGVRGPQLEISATIKFDKKDTSSVFGLSVLSGMVGEVPEHTDIGFDLANEQVFIDRRNSSAQQTDVDVRAGPMPKTLATPGELQLHVCTHDCCYLWILVADTCWLLWL